MTTQHTPEPWSYVLRGDYGDGMEADLSVNLEGMRGTLKEVDARRIVACVNACAGIDTDFLERTHSKGNASGIGKHLALEKQRDELLAALEGLTGDIQGLIGESCGVTGLHLNGDVATWNEIDAGGQFERLTHLPVAHAVIAKAKEGAA